MTTALAATAGIGNIVGVATAISSGGPGAILWMWVSAFFGMMTKYSEVVLAIKFRERNKRGEWVGGPMYYIKNGLGRKWDILGKIFCFFAVMASFGIGNIAQVNSISTSLNSTFSTLGINYNGRARLFLCRPYNRRYSSGKCCAGGIGRP